MIAPSDTDVQEGDTALFTCVAYGPTPPEISWYNNSDLIYNGTLDRITYYTDTVEQNGVIFVQSILELCGAELYDSGLYACVASYPGDYNRSTSASFYVNVISPEGLCVCVCVYELLCRAGSRTGRREGGRES